ncbi:MAG: acyltransferase [Stigonema ocellatum SAG 48.90 = DSM 106950]|nr:acyltransferase [Stigonema ocellatum SAG 48.90 = DSM 106950]
MAESKFFIPSLDGMRTVAFFIVFVAHTGLEKIVPGGFGVTIFFFLSGYLITTLLRREYERHQTIDLKSFYLRRMLRIWPPFYLVLVLGASLTVLGLLKGSIDPPAFLSQILHYNNYYQIFSPGGITLGSSVYWSLAIEEHFYLFFPLLYLALNKLGVKAQRQMLIFLGLSVAVLVWRCVLVDEFAVSSERTYYASDTRIDGLLIGCALAVYNNPMLDPQCFSDQLWKYFFLPAGISLIFLSLLYRSPDFRETFRYTIQEIGLYPIFFTAIRFPNWGLFQLLNLNWMRFIGKISYSLYLVHHTVIHAVWMYLPELNGVIQSGVALLISFALAYTIYQFIELPSGQLRKKLSN